LKLGFAANTALVSCLCFFSAAVHSACKFEVNEPSVKETKVFVIARGWNTGLSGHIGWNDGRFYLRGRYFTSYAATPSFDHRTPLEFLFADGSSMTLPVLEGAAGKLDYHPMLANNREAVPIFAIDAQQIQKIQQEAVVGVHLQRIDKQQVGSKNYKVSKRTARKIAEAAQCIEDSVQVQ
jgi:hypothetical protein